MLLDAVRTISDESFSLGDLSSCADKRSERSVCARFHLGENCLWVHARAARPREGETGLPLVLLHGFGLGARVWERQLEALSHDRLVVALDFRGHGDSEWDPSVDYGCVALVEDLITVLDGLGIERCLLVGHSMGADVALRYARISARRVAGLALVDMGPELEEKGRASLRGLAHRMPETFDTPEEYAGWLAAAHPLANASILHTLARQWVRPLPCGRYRRKLDPAFRDGRTARGKSDARWRALTSITQPTWVMRGASSPLLAESTAKQMRTTLPRGELCTIDRAGHCPMLDNPSGTTEALERFVAACDAPSEI